MNYALVVTLITSAIGLTCLLFKEYNAAFFMVTVSNIWSAAAWLDSRKGK